MDRMGHAQIQTTQKYLHALPDADQKNLDALERVTRRAYAHALIRDLPGGIGIDRPRARTTPMRTELEYGSHAVRSSGTAKPHIPFPYCPANFA